MWTHTGTGGGGGFKRKRSKLEQGILDNGMERKNTEE